MSGLGRPRERRRGVRARHGRAHADRVSGRADDPPLREDSRARTSPSSSSAPGRGRSSPRSCSTPPSRSMRPATRRSSSRATGPRSTRDSRRGSRSCARRAMRSRSRRWSASSPVWSPNTAVHRRRRRAWSRLPGQDADGGLHGTFHHEPRRRLPEPRILHRPAETVGLMVDRPTPVAVEAHRAVPVAAARSRMLSERAGLPPGGEVSRRRRPVRRRIPPPRPGRRRSRSRRAGADAVRQRHREALRQSKTAVCSSTR